MSERINGYADAVLAIAHAEGDVKGISDELFVVGRAVDTNDDLRAAISDARMPAERKIQIMEKQSLLIKLNLMLKMRPLKKQKHL